MTVLTNRGGGLGVALFGLALGCGATTHDGASRGEAGSTVAEQGGAGSGGREPSATGGVASDAGGDSQTAGDSSAVAGTGETQAGAPPGGASGSAGTGGAAGMGDAAGAGGAGEDPNKVVLFDGSEQTFNSWYPRNGMKTSANPWTNNGDGTMTVKSGGGDITSKMPFANVFVHVEYRSPKYDYSPATGVHGRGTSGVFLRGSYKLTIVDTFDLPPGEDVAEAYCGAIDYISKPLVAACKPGGEWNAYDIEFRDLVCTNGVKTTNAAFVEVRLNGILVQQNVVVKQKTLAGVDETCEPRGLMLQDRGSLVPVSFRNIWAIPRN